MEDRIKEMISEAVQTSTITRITYQEREALGRIYEEVTGEKADILCNACVVRMCNELNRLGYGKGKKNKQNNRRG